MLKETNPGRADRKAAAEAGEHHAPGSKADAHGWKRSGGQARSGVAAAAAAIDAEEAGGIAPSAAGFASDRGLSSSATFNTTLAHR